MQSRITDKDLEFMCRRINDATGNAQEQYTKQPDGKYKANAGNYHISGAYGGVALEQMCEGGGVRRISTGGYGTKRELYNWMVAFLDGLNTAQRKQK